MIRPIRRFLFPILCTALLAGGMLAQLALDPQPAFVAGPLVSFHISSTDTSAVFGQSVTLAVSMTGSGAVPTGTVNFSDGGAILCSGAPLTNHAANAAVATCQTAALSVGTHPITAEYSGDGNYDLQVSTDFETARSEVVAQAATTTHLDVDGTAVFSAPSSFTASVAPVSPGAGAVTGDVEFLADGASIGCDAQPMTNGVASCSSPAAAGTGSRNLTATYDGDTNFSTSTGTVAQALAKASSTVAVTSSNAHPGVGASVDYTATFTPTSPATETPDGDTVAFAAGGTTIVGCESVTISTGTAVCTTTADPRGTVSITALQAASLNFNASSSPAFVQNVGNLEANTVTSSDDQTSEFNESVTFTVTATPDVPGGPTPTGTMDFSFNTPELADCQAQPMTGGVATCTTSTLPVGDYGVEVEYSGDDVYTGGGISNAWPQIVSKATTSIAVTTDTDPSVYSQPIELTATLSSADGAPAGTLAFNIDGNPIVGCTARPMNAGVATCDTAELSASPGHQVDADFTTTADYAASSSPALFMDTDNAETTTAVTSSNATTSWSAPVTYTATISPTAPATLTPTRGHVMFRLNGDPITSCTTKAVTTGTATCALSTTPVGTNSIVAEFTPADSYNSSTSPDFTQTVAAATTTTAVTTSDPSAAWGDSVTFSAMTSVANGLVAPSTGTTTFSSDGTPISDCTAGAPTNGVATCTTTLAPIGDSSVTAAFVGDADYASSTATALTQSAVAATTTTLGSSSNPSVFSESVVFTATVATTVPGGATPTGAIEFKAGTTDISGCEQRLLVNGTITCTVPSFAVGDQSVTAMYLHTDTTYGTSTSNAITQAVGTAPTTTAITSSDTTTSWNESVTYTATMAATSPAIVTPDGGTVSFKAGGTAITGCATRPVSGGLATCTTIVTPVGTPSITVVFSGDGDFAASTSSGMTQTVSAAGTTTVVESSDTTTSWSAPVTFTATVSAVAPATAAPGSGTVSFKVNGTAISTCATEATTAGVATCTPATPLDVGAPSITAAYTGNTNYSTSTSPAITQTVSQAATTSAVVQSTSTGVFGQRVTFTTTVSPVSPATATPTGTVAFKVDGSNISACATKTVNSSGVATCTTRAVPTEAASITTAYSGDATYATSTTPPIVHTVGKATTTTGLTSDVNPSIFGTAVTFTATVSTTAPGVGAATGSIAFKIGAADITGCATKALDGSAVATCTTSASPVGTGSITAVYATTTNFGASTSTPVSQVIPQPASTTLVSSSDSSTAWNDPVTYTSTIAPVSPATIVPTGGTVAFRVDGATIPSCLVQPVVSGTATCSTSAAPVGTFAVTATFGGNLSYASSESPPILQTVTKAATATTLTSDHNPSRSGQAVSLSASVTSTAGEPSGTVSFFQVQKDSSRRLVGSGPLTAGVASMTTDAMTVRIGTIVASYDGDSTFRVSSVTTPQTVSRSSSNTLITSSQKRSVAGHAVAFHVVLASDGDGAGTPGGLVALYRVRTNGSREWIGRGTLHSTGDVTIAVSGLPVGSWKIVAEYRGSTEHRASHRSMTQSLT